VAVCQCRRAGGGRQRTRTNGTAWAEADQKSYRLIRLDNGLECLLVSTLDIVGGGADAVDSSRQNRSESGRGQSLDDRLSNATHVRTRLNSQATDETKDDGSLKEDAPKDDEANLNVRVSGGPKLMGAAVSSVRRAPRPSIGLVSGEAGRKLSMIAHPAGGEEWAYPPTAPSTAHRSSLIVDASEGRPAAFRVSRASQSAFDVADYVQAAAHRPSLGTRSGGESGMLDVKKAQEPPQPSPRTHRTSIRSSTSSRASMLLLPPLGEARMAAVCMAVGTGSFHSPPHLDGLAHYLEHVLFMGSEKYPKENGFDALLAQVGGSSNAYTDTERTVYHFTCPQHHLRETMDVFAHFFVNPLLLPEACERELLSIESEFALRQNIDVCRLQEIWRETAREDTPYATFTCGNVETLRDAPRRHGVDIYAALRDFHLAHYVAPNMRLCVVASDSLDTLEGYVRDVMRCLRPASSMSHSLPATFEDQGFPWRTVTPQTDLSRTRAGAGCLFRVVPTHNMHELQLTWQLPPQASLYRCKPAEHVAHLLGHESAGSVLAEAKARGWALALFAGTSPEDGFMSNTGCTLFNVSVALTTAGLHEWMFVAALVFEYIGVLKRAGPQAWVHSELRDAAAMHYKFQEEPDARWLAQHLCVRMLPQSQSEREHLLSGASLYLDWDPQAVSDVLAALAPDKVRVDLISSRLGKPTPEEGLTGRPKRPPLVERFTGAHYWVDALHGPVMESWEAVVSGLATVGYLREAQEQFPRTLRLPPRNPFISSEFTIVPPPPPAPAGHPLLGLDVKVKRERRGARRSQYERFEGGQVVDVSVQAKACLVKYQNGVLRWHRVDADDMRGSRYQKAKTTLMFDGGRTLVKVKGNDDSNNDEDGGEDALDHDVVGALGVWSGFPRVPKFGPVPALVPDSDELLSLWHLYDVSSRSPRVALFLNFSTPVLAESALSAALVDLFAVIVFESLTEESYLAFISELNFQIDVSAGAGIQLHLSGFSHKVPDLLEIVLKKLLSFSGDNAASFDTPLFFAHVEALLIDYANAASRFRSSAQVSSVMFEIICPNTWSPEAKAIAARDITPDAMAKFAKRIFAECSIEGLVQGNVSLEGACALYAIIDASVRSCKMKPLPKGTEPRLRAQRVPVVPVMTPVAGLVHVLEAVESPSHSVELFFQIDSAGDDERVLCAVLEHLLQEPLYAELRTKRQLGYSVKCGARMVCDSLGFVIEITSDTHGPEVLADDVDRFLLEFRRVLESMPPGDFIQHVCGLALMRLEKPTSLAQVSAVNWRTVLGHVFYDLPYAWDQHLADTKALRTVATQQRVLDAFDKWLNPASAHRRRASVFVVGFGYDVERLVVALTRPCVTLTSGGADVAAARRGKKGRSSKCSLM